LRVPKSEGDQRRRPGGAKIDSIMCTASLMKVSREGLKRKLRLRVAYMTSLRMRVRAIAR